MQPVTAEPSSRVIDASTAGLTPRDKFRVLAEVVRKALVDLECRPDREGPVRSVCQRDATGAALSVACIEASPHRVARLPAGISRSGDESLIFNFILSGSALAEQDGRSVLLKPGDGAVCDAQRPYNLRFDDAFKLITVKLPFGSLSHRSAGIHRITARSLTEAGQMCPILFGYLVDESTAAFHGRGGSRRGSRAISRSCSHRRSTRRFSAHRCLCPSTVPPPWSGSRISWNATWMPASWTRPWSVPRSTSRRGTSTSCSRRRTPSLARYVWRRRLERAACDLRDPARHSLGISTIAMARGFNDLSHFSRAFRQRFEMSPRLSPRGGAERVA